MRLYPENEAFNSVNRPAGSIVENVLPCGPQVIGDSERVNAPFARLVATLREHGLIEDYDPRADRRAYDLGLCAYFLQEMVAAAGIDILFHARALDAECRDSPGESVEVACGSDRILFQPAMVIDATWRLRRRPCRRL